MTDDKNLERLTKLLENLNANIEILSKVTALSFRKDSVFKDKVTKQEQVEALEDMKLPDDVIALIIGSTPDSVKSLRSQRKAKTKKSKDATTRTAVGSTSATTTVPKQGDVKQ